MLLTDIAPRPASLEYVRRGNQRESTMGGFMRRQSMIAIGAAGAVAVLGLAGCGRFDRAWGPVAPAMDLQAETSDLGWPGQALQAIGLDSADLAAAETSDTPSPQASASATATPANPGAGTGGGLKRRHRLVRYSFGHGVLHGEA